MLPAFLSAACMAYISSRQSLPDILLLLLYPFSRKRIAVRCNFHVKSGGGPSGRPEQSGGQASEPAGTVRREVFGQTGTVRRRNEKSSVRDAVPLKRHDQRADQDTEIGKVKNNLPQGLPFHIKAEIIHHIFPFQAVIGVAPCAAKQEGKPGFQGGAAVLCQGEEKHQ